MPSKKQVAFFAVLLLIFVLIPREALAQSSSITWKTDYFNAVSLSGGVARSATISSPLNQGFNSFTFPNSFLNTKTSHFDQFSARSTTTFSLAEPTHYLFGLAIRSADNEARLLIDGQPIIATGNYSERTKYKLLAAGSHTITVEYQHYFGDRNYQFVMHQVPREQATIEAFSVTPTLLSAETTQLSINWRTSGLMTADRIQIDTPNNKSFYNVGPSGTVRITLPALSPYQGSLYSGLSGVRFSIIRQGSTVTDYLPFECTAQSWFFANAPKQCPLQTPQALDMEIQYFTNGATIWNKSSNHVTIFYGENGQRGTRTVAWSANSTAGTNLGSAISDPVAYSGFMQCDGTGCYFATPSNQVYFENNGQTPSAWEVVTRTVTARRGTVTPPVVTPPTTGGGGNSGGGCQIPASGPWPACASNGGGGTTNPPTSNGGGSCVIPATGPWPACATSGGGGTTTTPPASGGGCTIPTSGPWPACATSGGGSTAGSGGGSCVIPDVGPWPACAK